jgi:hypothetical protein
MSDACYGPELCISTAWLFDRPAPEADCPQPTYFGQYLRVWMNSWVVLPPGLRRRGAHRTNSDPH